MGGHERLLTTREVAALFRVDEKTVRRWVDAGRLTVIRTPTGRKLLFRESEVRAQLAPEDVRPGHSSLPPGEAQAADAPDRAGPAQE